MSLLPHGDLDAAPDDLKAQLKGRLPVNLYRVMMHSPAALGAFLAFASKMSKHDLGKPLREVIILRVAALRGARYVSHQHLFLSLAMDFTREKIEAIEAGDRSSPLLDATERALLRFIDELTLQNHASREAFDALAEYLTPRQMIDAVMVAGQYFMVSGFVRTFEVDIEPEGEISFDSYLARSRWQPTVGV